jgi:hypothetical protein
MPFKQKTLLTLCGLLAVLIGIRAWFGLRTQPQLPASEEVFKSVDALFTAVTARDESRLAACEERLARYHQSAELSDAAWKRLKAVIATARGGQWEPAARRLYDFMHGQRRAEMPVRRASPLTAMRTK